MAPETHALLSASSAARWLHCTAAPRLEAQFPENTSTYAEEGRLAHAICELKVIKHFTMQIKPRAFTAKLNKLKAAPLYNDEMDKTSDFVHRAFVRKSHAILHPSECGGRSAR